MDKAELERAYDEAGSLRGLARALGITHSGAKLRLAKAGIPVRNSRPGTTPPRKAPSAADKRMWQRMYDEAGSVNALAREMGKASGTIAYHLKWHGVDIKQDGFLSPKTVTHEGVDHHNWKGGTYYHPEGYIYEYAPNHPAAASAKGYVLQHRLVMEATLGRYLTPHELVHHKNEIKDDNRPENLEIMDRSAHISHHKETAPRDAAGRFSV